MITSHSPEEKISLSNLLRNDLKADVDLSQTKINYIGDMDLLFALFSRTSAAEKKNIEIATEIRKILGISDKDFSYTLIKGTAFSGLWVNAGKHPKILELCRAELSARKDKKDATELHNILNSAVVQKDAQVQKR